MKRVTEGMEELRYNTTIAALMELVNVVMLAPFAPHFAEESSQRLGRDTSVFDAQWQAWDSGGGSGRGGDAGEREDAGEGVGAVGSGAGCGGGGGAGGFGGEEIYGGEGGSEGSLRAESAVEPSGRIGLLLAEGVK